MDSLADVEDCRSSVWRAVSTRRVRSAGSVGLQSCDHSSTGTDLSSCSFGADADECWTTMTNALQALPGVGSSNGNFVSQYMMGEMVKESVQPRYPSSSSA